MTNRPTKLARQHLEAMISLANILISESINETDPILPPFRTLSKEDFLEQYGAHSCALKELLLNLKTEPVENVDAAELQKKLQESRESLVDLVGKLQKKIDKLNDLCFWMDNMISDRNPAPK